MQKFAKLFTLRVKMWSETIKFGFQIVETKFISLSSTLFIWQNFNTFSLTVKTQNSGTQTEEDIFVL